MRRRRRLRLRSVDSRIRLERPQSGRDPCQQSAAANGGDNGGNVRQILDDFDSCCGISSDEAIVVERMNEVAAHAIRSVAHGRLPALVVARPDDGGAEAVDRVDLRLWRAVYNHHRAGDAGQPRGVGDAECCIACADGPYAAFELLAAELTDDVESASDLERSDGLQGFKLEVELQILRRACRRIDPDQGCSNRAAVDAGGGFPNRVDGNDSPSLAHPREAPKDASCADMASRRAMR